MIDDYSAQKAIFKRKITKSTQVLTGIIVGMTADGHINDQEIHMLATWLKENAEVTSVWPGSAIAKHVSEVLIDGNITDEERKSLLYNLQKLSGSDFSETGSVTDEVVELPFDTPTHINLLGSKICLTGEFMYGTRAACERLVEKLGGAAMSTVSKKVNYLIVGSQVSPLWVNTSYGTKILKAIELKESGHQILIIREQQWFDFIQ